MAIDKSRSPRKDTKRRHRSRSRSRSRGRDRGDQERKRRRGDRTKSRSKSRSPRGHRRRGDSASRGHRSQRDHNSRRRSRSRSKDDDVVFVCEQRPGEIVAPTSTTVNDPVDLTDKAAEPGNEDDLMMKKLMGFATFDTTKGKKVGGNDQGTSRINVKRKYRQYMNRVGGFNRPLDPVH